MVHAGWRGLAAGVLEEGVGAMRELGATGQVAAAIGPGAGGCCYEVGEEVGAAFADVTGAMRGRNLDLKAVAAARLRAAGVLRSTTRACARCATRASSPTAATGGRQGARGGLRGWASRGPRADRRGRVARAGRDPGEVEMLAATKYVALEELGVLAEAGLTLVGENRAQDLRRRRRRRARRLHVGLHRPPAEPQGEELVPRSCGGSTRSAAIRPRAGQAPPRCAPRVRRADRGERRARGGQERHRRRPSWARSWSAARSPPWRLMTMPPAVGAPSTTAAGSRRCASWPPRTACRHLSMGTSQDYEVAVEEGATIVRLGSDALPRRHCKA